jgi:hypothetical protein
MGNKRVVLLAETTTMRRRATLVVTPGSDCDETHTLAWY